MHCLFRYIIIVHPRISRKFQRLRGIIFLLILIYVLPISLTIGFSLPKIDTAEVVFNRHTMFCSFVRHTDFRLSAVLKKIVFLSVAALFLMYCYLRIYYLVRSTRNSIISGESAFTPIRLRREITLLKTMIVIFATFIVSYLPISVIYALDQQRTFPYYVYFIGVFLLWLSSSVNWLIYYSMNRQYRHAITQLLCCRPPNPKQHRHGMIYISTENGSNSVFEVTQLGTARGNGRADNTMRSNSVQSYKTRSHRNSSARTCSTRSTRSGSSGTSSIRSADTMRAGYKRYAQSMNSLREERLSRASRNAFK